MGVGHKEIFRELSTLKELNPLPFPPLSREACCPVLGRLTRGRVEEGCRGQLMDVLRIQASEGTACDMDDASSTKTLGRLQHSVPARWGADEQRAGMTLPTV